MKARFLVDAQLPPALARALTAGGFAANHVQDLGLLMASDEAIWAYALKKKVAIITKDGDFADFRSLRAGVAAVVWLRIGNTASQQLVQWLLPLMPKISAAIDAGDALVEVRP